MRAATAAGGGSSSLGEGTRRRLPHAARCTSSTAWVTRSTTPIPGRPPLASLARGEREHQGHVVGHGRVQRDFADRTGERRARVAQAPRTAEQLLRRLRRDLAHPRRTARSDLNAAIVLPREALQAGTGRGEADSIVAKSLQRGVVHDATLIGAPSTSPSSARDTPIAVIPQPALGLATGPHGCM